MNTVARIGTLVLCSALAGCASSRISAQPLVARLTAPIKVIALDPSGGLLADAVGVELSNRGYTVLDTATTSKMLARLNINEVEISTPIGLERLKAEGVDAYLAVRAAGGYDQQPQSASARVNSTDGGQVVAGITWQNGWGGQPGSIMDRTMRMGLSEAASEIADALVESLNAATSGVSGK